MANNQNQKIREHYDVITNGADRISRMKKAGREILQAEKNNMMNLIKNAGSLFMVVLNRIQGNVINDILEMDILLVVKDYAEKTFHQNFYSVIMIVNVLRPIVRKLSPVEIMELKTIPVNGKKLVIINKENCLKMADLAEENFEITLSERNALKNFLADKKWFKEPVKEKVEPEVILVAEAEVVKTPATDEKEIKSEVPVVLPAGKKKAAAAKKVPAKKVVAKKKVAKKPAAEKAKARKVPNGKGAEAKK
ncbi:MAG: hypothetical protein ABH951_00260 [Patescibacteria group bacterium]